MEIQVIKEKYNVEIALIILCLRQFLNESDDTLIPAFLKSNNISWESLRSLAAAHRVRPIIYQSLVPFSNLIGAETLKQLRSDAFYITACALTNKSELLRITQILSQNNIEFKVFKGIDFSERMYGNLGLREFSDNDLIIDSSSIDDVIKIMVDEGYYSKDQQFYKRFPTQYIRDYKDIFFEKHVNGLRQFAFEFHFKTTRYFQCYPSSFKNFLGNEYLSRDKNYTDSEYLKIMTLNSGLMDLYPDLRSVMDLAIIVKKYPNVLSVPFDSILNDYLNYGLRVSAGILDYPCNRFSKELSKSKVKLCDEMQLKILTVKHGNRIKIIPYFVSSFKISKSISRKISLVLNLFLLILRPNIDDFNGVSLPYYFIYYFTKPVRILAKYLKRGANFI